MGKFCRKWKWKQKDVVHENIRNIKYKDVDIDVEVNDKNPKALSYGGVEVTNNMNEILTMNPKMMMYNKVDLIETECEIEKAMMKCRFSLNLQLLSYKFLCKFKHKTKIGSVSNFKLTKYFHEPIHISSLLLGKLSK